MRTLALAFAALAALAGCGSGTNAPATAVDWTTNAASYRGQNGSIVIIQCAANPSLTNTSSVWGTGTYSDDSSMCMAAAHAGVITPAAGGRVAVTIAPGQDAYTGSTRNGITTDNWPAWPGSFTVAAG